MYLVCPECRKPGRVRVVSRSQLVLLARDAGCELLAWPASSGAGYWWCDGCSNGGALFRWSKPSRSA